MTLRIDRRSLILTGTLGLAALAIPGFAWAMDFGGGFTHSVASGEPGADTMLLWTRYVPAGGGGVKLRGEVSLTADFARIAGGGEIVTGPWRDHTAKLTVQGLEPGTRYFYRFVAPDGAMSPIGRTRTLPVGKVRRFGIAVFSCCNMPFGYFNAYAHAAARDDVDLALHLGDYLYEYAKDGYAPAGGAVDGRVPLPQGEAVALADYRLRYASYRADPDLQSLHASKPMIVSMDDHELGNNSWEGGAQNHQSNEGDYTARRAAAMQAWREWMPVSETPWGSYDIGGLATLFRTDTRLAARSEGGDLGALMQGRDPVAALTAYRDGAWREKAATMLGSEQEAWLAHGMARSVRAGQQWQVVGFGTILGRNRVPKQAMDWLRPDAPQRVKGYTQAGVTASKLGLPADLDNWGGYPEARARFLRSSQAMGANLIVLCGDSHNAWAFELGQDGEPAGVEFAGTSVTSPGNEAYTAADPRVIERALIETNPEVQYCEMSKRGYLAVTFTPEQVRNDFVFVDTILTRSMKANVGHSAIVQRGRNRITG